MHDDDIRATKAEVLRTAADEFRRAAAAGQAPESNLLAASLLEQRAARIEAGEDDHSQVSAADIHAEAHPEREQPEEGADVD
ncbi:hypothetical protein [Microbacterium saperdae]|uniref:Uncharacterized protein n=1 Tax=Microbacterium saperdae TaxID=69368 RepID=A0A543BMA5_9MICO|nr:hypothetical protein [Microbacterium saperdae]TQL85970.1 hypothetical protein FB560_1607 [Microbacterium saperdae]GGM51614.1 hypothetical protein GCM10010489_23930 [Microbacterium saperdae]